MIGIDIVDIERFKKIGEEDFSSWEKVFTKEEWQYSLGQANSSERLAGIFAAKEAVMKAIGGNLVGRFNRIEITHSADGRPVAVIKNEKQVVEISISHDKNTAVAVAVVSK